MAYPTVLMFTAKVVGRAFFFFGPVSPLFLAYIVVVLVYLLTWCSFFLLFFFSRRSRLRPGIFVVSAESGNFRESSDGEGGREAHLNLDGLRPGASVWLFKILLYYYILWWKLRIQSQHFPQSGY